MLVYSTCDLCSQDLVGRFIAANKLELARRAQSVPPQNLQPGLPVGLVVKQRSGQIAQHDLVGVALGHDRAHLLTQVDDIVAEGIVAHLERLAAAKPLTFRYCARLVLSPLARSIAAASSGDSRTSTDSCRSR